MPAYCLARPEPGQDPRQIRIATTPEPSHLHTASSNLWRFWKLAAGLSLALLVATALLSLVDPLPVEPHQPQVPYLPDTALNETLRRGEEQTVAPMALRSRRKLHRTEKPTRESDSVLRGIQRIGNALGAHVVCVRTDFRLHSEARLRGLALDLTVPACYLVKATSTAPFSKSLSLRRMKSRRRCRPSKLPSPSLETLGCLTVADRWLREFPHQMHSGDQNR